MSLDCKIPPPLVLLITGGTMWAVDGALPELRWTMAAHVVVAVGMLMLGGLAMLVAFVGFLKARTTVNPLNPDKTTALVTSGIYRYSRNPIYLGDVLVLFGWSMYLQSAAALVLIALFVMYINRYQIEPEENALLEKFGQHFESYKRTTRRWI